MWLRHKKDVKRSDKCRTERDWDGERMRPSLRNCRYNLMGPTKNDWPWDIILSYLCRNQSINDSWQYPCIVLYVMQLYTLDQDRATLKINNNIISISFYFLFIIILCCLCLKVHAHTWHHTFVPFIKAVVLYNILYTNSIQKLNSVTP